MGEVFGPFINDNFKLSITRRGKYSIPADYRNIDTKQKFDLAQRKIIESCDKQSLIESIISFLILLNSSKKNEKKYEYRIIFESFNSRLGKSFDLIFLDTSDVSMYLECILNRP